MGFGTLSQPCLPNAGNRYPEDLGEMLMTDPGQKFVGGLSKIHRHLYALRFAGLGTVRIT